MTTCSFCRKPVTDRPGFITIDGQALPACPVCNEWEYLQEAQSMTGAALQARLSAVRNALYAGDDIAAMNARRDQSL